jgi:PadR family transcriptional regulator PadR
MPARPHSSPQTRQVLAALLQRPDRWRHGYDISQQTGLASGTLYPILGRLADRGLLATCWEEDPPEGRPRRHLYRLTADGAALAERLGQEAEPAARKAVPAGRKAVRGAAIRGRGSEAARPGAERPALGGA